MSDSTITLRPLERSECLSNAEVPLSEKKAFDLLFDKMYLFTNIQFYKLTHGIPFWAL